MPSDPEKLDELLSQISLDLMMMSPDNLVEVGELLDRLAPLGEDFAFWDSDIPAGIIAALNKTLEAQIRGQLADSSRAVELIGAGLVMLQELARSLPVGAPFKGDHQRLIADLEALATGAGLYSEYSLPDSAPAQKARIAEPESGAAASSEAGGEELNFSLGRFKSEFIEAVEQIQVLLVAAEQKPDPVAALSELGSRFRTILGAASLLGLEDLARLAADSGQLVEYVASDHVPYVPSVTDILLKSCNYLISGLKSLELYPGQRWGLNSALWPPADLEQFNENLWSAQQGFLPSVTPPVTEGTGSQSGAAPVKSKKLGEILIAKGLISEGDLGGLIEAQSNARKVRLGDILVGEKLITEGELQEALEHQKTNPDKKIGEILVAAGKLDYEQIDWAVKAQETQRETKLGEILVKSKIGAPDKVAAALREQKQVESPHGGVGSNTQTVKVETQKLDGLIDLVGELVIAQSLIVSNTIISELKDQKIVKDMAQVSRITSELQRNAMSLRMVTIRQTFLRMNRLVRDLAHKFEKEVELETVGEDTEIDRNMVESLYDPLVHMIRNALDHGLETTAERLEKGKPPKGTVTLKAHHQSGNVVIELHDDGRGLDTEKVLAKAVEKGLITADEILSEAAIHALVFNPGFSTAAKVSEISGRGVGMDVVKKSIEQLRGKVDFTSVRGRGSTMTIRLPLTLAIIDGMIIRIGEHRYILPTISINESFRPLPGDYYTIKGQGEMIKVREQFLPLIRLDQIVEARGAARNPSEALVVVIENEGERRGLLVDEVLGKQEVVIKSLGEALKSVRSLAGGTILGDGRVGLILDVTGLFEYSTLGGNSSQSGEDWDMASDTSSWSSGA